MATGKAAPHIYIVAGEESGDRLGAALIRAIRERAPDAIRISGVGGDQMSAEGIHSLFPLGDLAIIGFTAIIGRLRGILRRIRETAEAVIAAKPDVLVIIDSPEFTHRVARKVRTADPSIAIIDYVSPSVWAWRPGRAKAMRGYIDHVLGLLPFEPEVYVRLGGPPCEFVGHPIGERAGMLRPNAEEAKRRDSQPPVVLVMPGSRTAEIRRMLPVYEQTIRLLMDRVGAMDVVIPTVPRLANLVRAAVTQWPIPVRVVVEQTDKDAAFRIARAALVKSGTGTLELAVAGVPMAAAYRASWIEGVVLLPLIKTPSVILANLVLGDNVVPEFIQNDAEPERLTLALLPLLGDTPERQKQVEAFKRLDAIMEIKTARPSDRAAKIVLDYALR